MAGTAHQTLDTLKELTRTKGRWYQEPEGYCIYPRENCEAWLGWTRGRTKVQPRMWRLRPHSTGGTVRPRQNWSTVIRRRGKVTTVTRRPIQRR